ncbi:MAG: hypothetical protein OXG47_05245 [bacterium]|nr:hypothetical protein [bacterium]MCY3924910.1 hypothetical protein [bacterium]
MTTQMMLIPESAAPTPSVDGAGASAGWMLDDETRAIGRQGVAEARAILRARRRAADRSGRGTVGAQPAA